MEKWILETKKADFNQIAAKYHITPVLARIMVNRGVKTEKEIEEYLYGDVSMLESPYQLKDIEKAVGLIEEAIENHVKIVIASDFDVDGIFSSFVLYKAFTRLGGNAVIDTPDRIKEGYGLNQRIVNDARENGVGMIVTCDNGIAAREEIAYAKELGMKVVVTDHHEVPFEENENGERQYVLPAADAIVNPKQADCTYPFKKLCGAGVAYKVVEVLYERKQIEKNELYDLLEYVAIATIADVMDLERENRTIVKYGLEQLRHTKNIGLHALIEVNQLDFSLLNAYHIGFIIGPCFNAAGRLDTVKMALELLMCHSNTEALEKASELKALNESRKEMTNKGLEQAIEKIEQSDLKNDKVLLVKLENCHESLVGIIAGRIREKYHKPVLVFTEVKEGVKGSGRSIEAYNMFEELLKCKELLGKFGGHPMAAGLTLPLENYELLRKQLNDNAILTEKDFIPVVRIDVPMPIGYITESFINELNLLEPFGKGNTKPLFAEQHFSILGGRVLGKNKNVLKMKVQNQNKEVIDAIYFGDVEEFLDTIRKEYGEQEADAMLSGAVNHIDMGFTYYPSVNEYMGRKTVQIVIQNYCRIPFRRNC